MTRYDKSALEYDEILSMLKERGLVILNDNRAVDCLRTVSYFRLANYFRPMEEDKKTHGFKTGSFFESAIDLYEFDQELRSILFDATQNIEIALRSKMIHLISLKYGAFWFADASLFYDVEIFESCMQHLRHEVERSREDFIIEHLKRYSEPDIPPVWKTLEVATFGTLSKLLCNFKDSSMKKRIAREFDLPQHKVLENWIKCMVTLRNHIAHHSRIWNRNFPNIPQTNVSLKGAWLSQSIQHSHKLYSYLCCIQYMLNSINDANDFPQNLSTLFDKYPNSDLQAMGIPQDWKTEELWCR